MQISKIILYGKKGQMRELSFRLGSVNIVSGRSQRGKSAILAVIDYCLGSKKLNVPAGIIQNSVSWYALELDFHGDKLFIARPSADPGKGAPNVWHIGREVVEADSLEPLYGRDDLLARVSGRLGVSTTVLPRSGGELEKKHVTFRSGLIFSFQKQNEIANQDLFFHRQSEAAIAQVIRDYLPYYLGAVSESIIAQQEELRFAKKRLRELERELARVVDAGAQRDKEASYLLTESQRVGLAPPDVGNLTFDKTIPVLAMAEEISLAEPSGSGSDRMAMTTTLLIKAQEDRADLKQQIEALEAFGKDQDIFSESVNEQRRRLKSLHLYRSGDISDSTCPLCESQLSTPAPNAVDLTRSLALLTQELNFVARDKGQLDDALLEKRTLLSQTEESIAEHRRTIARIKKEEEAARIFLERKNEAARIGGMIHMFLRVGGNAYGDDRRALEAERDGLASKIEEIESDLEFNSVKNRVAKFLGGIGQTITNWAREERLGYSEGFLTFDMRGPQLVSETPSGTIPFSRFGSGKNWVWYHLLGHMALHKWFVENDRPTPRFIVLDQPSQVYFPSDHPEAEEEDLDEVRRIYQWLFEINEKLGGQFQIIVTDHAYFRNDPEFMSNLTHNWWEEDEALIPYDWQA